MSLWPELKKLQDELAEIIGPVEVDIDHVDSLYQRIGEAWIAGEEAWQRAFDGVCQAEVDGMTLDEEISMEVAGVLDWLLFHLAAVKSPAFQVAAQDYNLEIDGLFTTENSA